MVEGEWLTDFENSDLPGSDVSTLQTLRQSHFFTMTLNDLGFGGDRKGSLFCFESSRGREQGTASSSEIEKK